jgi:hypothetical protein
VLLDNLSFPTSLALLAMLTITVSGLVYLAQLTSVDGAKDVDTGSGKPIPNLCTAVATCCPTFSKTIRLTNDTIHQKDLHAAAVGSNTYILWKETEKKGDYPGPLYLVRSTDNGHTFGNKTQLVDEVYASNIAAYGNNVYVVFFSSGGVFLIKSTDGGNNFGSPVKVNGIALLVGYGIKIGAFGNNVYIVWTEFPGQFQDVFFMRSTDGGNSFSDKKNISANYGQSVYPDLEVVGNNIYVVWIDYTVGNSEVYFKRSVDGGTSFSKLINLSNNPSFGDGGAAIGSLGNNVYVFWDDANSGLFSILMRKSSDEGHTFGVKKIITSAGVFPLVDVSSDNKVHLSWTEKKRNAIGVDFIYERSVNEGTSFSCSTKLKASTTEQDARLISSDGRVFIFWLSYEPSEEGYQNDVFFWVSPPK